MLKLGKNYKGCSSLFKNIHNPSRTSLFLQSTKSAVDNKNKDSSEKNVAEEIKFTEVNINTKTHQKLPQREPLVKNFFLGRVDIDLITYPEVLPKEEVTKLFETRKTNQEYFANKSDTVPIQNILQELNLFGSNVPQTFSGQELLTTEEIFLSEVEAETLELGLLVGNHRMISKLILDHGSDEQKLLYLPKLAKGEIVATSAVFEAEATESGAFNTSTTFNDDDSTYSINGTKSFVINGSDANLLLVLANTPIIKHTGDRIFNATAFLVDPSAHGVEISPPELSFGCRKVARSTIKFNNVKLTKRNILGEPLDGTKIAFQLMRMSRIQTALLATIRLKDIMRKTADYCIRTIIGGIYLKDTEIMKNRIAKTVCSTYALESMLYMTTSLMDAYEGQDVDMETSILKVFALENLWTASTDAMYSMGERCLTNGADTDKFIRDAAQLMTQGETLDSVKLFLGLTGLQHAGLQLHDIVRKERNPLLHPGYILSKIFEKKNLADPKITLNLGYNLHPTLDPAAQWLEQSIKRIQIATEVGLARYGHEIIERQLDVIRLTDAAVLSYAMFASVARASRAYCIGLRNADYEMLIANAFCLDATEKIKQLTKDIENGEFLTNDNNLAKIAKQLFKSKGYFAEHPLTRNF